MVDWTSGWTSPEGMIPAPGVRAIALPKARLPTPETNSLRGPAGSSAVSGRGPGARGFSCSWIRSGSGVLTAARIRARRCAAQGPFGWTTGYLHHHMRHGGETERRANVLEIVGAWLHLWVPPRDVEIPPVPWRKL